jgi:protein gp37
MSSSSIEWTEQTWNPTTGCSKISQGCKLCYAEIMTRRLKAMGQAKYQAGFNQVVTHPSELEIPLRRKKPTVWFVDSMSDLFHKDVPVEFIEDVFAVMNQTDWHTYQILTKRSERMWSLSPFLNWPPNVWMGVSVEDSSQLERIDHLHNSSAQVKFLSLEPLLGPLPNLNLTGIDWVIVGGESGRRPRPVRQEWIEDIQQQCERAKVAFFFKQWGGTNKKLSGRTLNGRTYEQMPGYYK